MYCLGCIRCVPTPIHVGSSGGWRQCCSDDCTQSQCLVCLAPCGVPACQVLLWMPSCIGLTLSQQVAWCVQLESFHSGADVTLWAAVHGADRGSGGGDGSGTGGNSSGGGGGATNGRPSREVEVRYNTRQLKAIWSAARQGQQPAQARRTWCWVRGGVLHIDEGEAPAVVRLGWRSHNDW